MCEQKEQSREHWAALLVCSRVTLKDRLQNAVCSLSRYRPQLTLQPTSHLATLTALTPPKFLTFMSGLLM